MKYNFKEKGKMAMMTGAEIAVVTGTMLVSQKYLDFKVLFKNKIAADPAFVENWYIKHQGGIKFGIGVLAAIHIKNPWLRLLGFGVALNGAIQEVRVLTTTGGVPMFDAIGNADERLRRAALSTGALSNKYPSQVAGVTNAYPSQVARPIDLMNYNYSTTGQARMTRGTGVAMMRRAA